MRPVIRSWVSAAAALCVLTAPLDAQNAAQAARQQPQAPTFHAGTQVVQVDVRVFDGNTFVTDLKPEDFEIKEDGVPQKIVGLTLVKNESTPAAAGASPASSTPSEASPTAPAPKEPAIWIFVFDTVHLSNAGLHNTQTAVVDFLRSRFHDGDVGGIVVDGRMVNNRLTSVRDELVKAAQSIKLPNTTFQYQTEMTRDWPRIKDEFEAWRIADQMDKSALGQAVARACADDSLQCPNADAAVQSKARNIMTTAHAATDMTLRVIEALSNGLAKMPGPKTIVFVSEGFILSNRETDLQQATGLANRAGAHFYTVDARGMNKGGGSIIDQAQAFDDAGPSNTFDLQADGTNALAVDTGGMAIRNMNNFAKALDVIQQDASTYYVLGYTPANQTFDGKFRKIDVTVKRAGVKVRARRGYLALKPAKLLRPVPVAPGAAASSATAAAAAESSSTTSAAAPAPAVPTITESPIEEAAKMLETRIESRHLVETLQKSTPASAQRLAPTSNDADLAGKGWAAYQRGDVEHAVVYLGEAAKSPDVHPWVPYALGLAHLALGHYQDAVASWVRVRAAAPDFEPVYFNLADGYMLQKNDDAALKVLRDAQQRWPKDPDVWNASGVLEIRKSAVDAAVKSFTAATTVAPNDSLGFFNLARAYQMRAAQSQRYDPHFQKWIGGEGDTRKAAENYQKYIQMGGPFVDQAKQALQMLNWKR